MSQLTQEKTVKPTEVSGGDTAEAKLATGETVHGTIRYVAPVANAATRTFQVELEVDNGDGRLRAGGTAELRIPAETVLAHRVSPSLLTLDDAGNVGIRQLAPCRHDGDGVTIQLPAAAESAGNHRFDHLIGFA